MMNEENQSLLQSKQMRKCEEGEVCYSGILKEVHFEIRPQCLPSGELNLPKTIIVMPEDTESCFNWARLCIGRCSCGTIETLLFKL